MSRGLSKRQRDILGLAYSVRCAWHGGKFVEYAEPIEPPDDIWRVWHILTNDERLPDYRLSLGLHFLAGLPFSNGHTMRGSWTVNNPGIFAHSKESRCCKASLSRSANTLLRQGYFAWQDGKDYRSWGFVLTPKAYDIAVQHQIVIEAETAIALFLGFNATAKHWQSDWMAKDYQRFVDKLANEESRNAIHS